MSKRDVRGRFASGCAPGPGRRPRATEHMYLTATMQSCSPADWTAIVCKAVKQAKAGDASARSFLAKIFIPTDPSLLSETLFRAVQEINEDGDDDPDDAGDGDDEEIRAILRRVERQQKQLNLSVHN